MIQKALQITRKVLKENGLTGWTATTNRRKSSFGLCDYRKRQIQLSTILTPNCTEEAIMNTIFHEVAHAIIGSGHGHDRVWKSKCLELGGNGLRCGGSDNYIDGDREFLNKSSKYTLECPVCGNTVPRSRKLKRDISCGKHGDRRFNPNHKMKLIQNY